MGDPLYWRESVRALEYMIPECEENINCIVHDTNLPFPEYLKELSFHLILLGPTFLCNRHDPKNYARICKDYSFIAESDACKVALPQDDYDTSAVLDEWLTNWRVDRVYSVLSDNLDILYPNYLESDGEIVLGYTGYISDEWINAWNSPKPHHLRNIDVSYRTHDYERNLCYFRNLKYSIAQKFLKALELSDVEIKTDISTSPRDMIPGGRWHHFIEDSKFCLVTPSGSSLFDPTGSLRKNINQYCKNNPDASYSEVAANVLGENYKQYFFTAISPRNIEAALAKTIQIATKSEYSGLMKPMKHYIPLEEDCSNIREVIEMMQDESLIKSIQNNALELFLNEPRLRRRNITREILDYAYSKSGSKNIPHSNQTAVEGLIKQYHREMQTKSKLFWKKQRMYLAVKKYSKKIINKAMIKQ